MFIHNYFKIVLSLAVLLLAYGLMIEAFHLMNQPSDRGLYGGLAIVLGLLLSVPLVLYLIWRRKTWQG